MRRLLHFLVIGFFFFFGCSQKKEREKKRLFLKKENVLSSNQQKKSLFEKEDLVPLRQQSSLKDIPVSFSLPQGFHVRFFEDKLNFLYSTLVLIESELQKKYPVNIAMTQYREKKFLTFQEVFDLDRKKKDSFLDASAIEKKNLVLRGESSLAYFFTYRLIVPILQNKKDPSSLFIKEEWIYLRNNNILYELKLKSSVDDFEKYEKVFYQFINDLNFL